MRTINSDISDFFLRAFRESIEYREKNKIRRNDFLDLLIQLKTKGRLEGVDSDSGTQINRKNYFLILILISLQLKVLNSVLKKLRPKPLFSSLPVLRLRQQLCNLRFTKWRGIRTFNSVYETKLKKSWLNIMGKLLTRVSLKWII